VVEEQFEDLHRLSHLS
jgi:DNA repair protein RAD7